jgi:hypothetical protein
LKDYEPDFEQVSKTIEVENQPTTFISIIGSILSGKLRMLNRDRETKAFSESKIFSGSLNT